MKKNKWLGSLLNFLVPGLGHAYGRKIKKGILTYILFFVVVLSLRFITYNFLLFLISLLLIAAYYVCLIVSGYSGIQKDKVYEPSSFDKWYVYILVLALHWGFVNSFKGRTLDNFTPINFAVIPTPAMDPGLVIGDRIAFKKTKFIESNDVVIFWFPDDIKTIYIKRCIGLPGDSMQIRRGDVLINGIKNRDIPLKYKYLVTTNGGPISQRVLEDNRIVESDYYKLSSEDYICFLTNNQAANLKKLDFLKNVESSFASEGVSEPMIFPKSESLHWNADFYGPFYIPKKGARVELTETNIDLYLKCIEFENASVERDGSQLKINGQMANTYQFKENYFFMMGDNRHNSLDSRYWGFLPQNLVIGKAMYFYWGRSFDRIGKKVL